ncbi:MAG: alpha-amylase family glycosyl hydrolase [Candidatus Izemoplasmataceae bacterium]
MSVSTDVTLRDAFIYQVFVRNHTEEGTFKALEKDLDRIRGLGVDIVYLLPVHPIGELRRKGTLGSPYSIKDYRSINESLGTKEDFEDLIEAVHRRGMKIMMDIVFNHTAYDSVLFKTHPEWFYQENGRYTNRVGDWWDIVDFDYEKADGLEAALIRVLEDYTKMGVDGFRFDVASFLPLGFLERAHQAVKAIDPDTIWLSESVHGDFLRAFRNEGFEGLSEGEIYRVFDMAYDYDTQPAMEAFMKGEGPLQDYIGWLRRQEAIYPKNYVKLRNLENHDFGRVATLLDNDATKLVNWHAFSFYSKGATMIYAGGETLTDHHPDLFNKDPLKKGPKDISPLIRTLSGITRGPLYTHGVYDVLKPDGQDVIAAHYTWEDTLSFGLFNIQGLKGETPVPLKDGDYENLLDGKPVKVHNGRIHLEQAPLIVHAPNDRLKREATGV